MQQWEYCTIHIGGEDLSYLSYQVSGARIERHPLTMDTMASAIATLGLHGWELVGIDFTQSNGAGWTFKRPLQAGNQYFTFQ
jgi:hypothetical protein